MLMPLTYSISTGLAFGFISFVLLKLCLGKIREVRSGPHRLRPLLGDQLGFLIPNRPRCSPAVRRKKFYKKPVDRGAGDLL